jgi:glyoxylase-like metal-dependent hydrolase (beta-lactamase superfamily II)
LADLLPEAPGIRAAAAYGHTPGHTLFLIESEGEQLLLWGDLTIAMAVQMPLPKVATTYDRDPDASVASRLQVLRYAAERDVVVGGAHIPYPGMGRLAADPAIAGGFTFTPIASAPA